MSHRYRFPLALIFLLTALCIFVMVSSAATDQIFEYKHAGPSGESFVQDEILVKFKPDIRNDEIDKINRGLGIAEAHRTYSGVFRLKVPESRFFEMIEIYNKLPNVEYAEPNYIAHAFAAPNDPLYNLQWNMGAINTESAWEKSTGSGVVVAVVDTGVAYENYGIFMQAPDLVNTNFVAGYDFVNDDAHPNDDNSHGTHVAGTIAQSTNNGEGVAGVAFDTTIMPVKVLNKKGSGTYTDIADGIRWAADNGAKVINMSLGGSVGSSTLEGAVQYAHDKKGVTIIAAAGNDGAGAISYPAAYDAYVIAVGATRYDNTLSYYSNYGPSLDLVAPGGDVNLDQNGDGYGDGVLQNTFNPTSKNTSDFGYWFFQGTSMAAPHVSGVAALLIANGVTGPDNVSNVLQSTAVDLGAAGRDDYYGYGLVNAAAALGNSPPAPINNPPAAVDDNYTTDEDTQLAVGAPGVLSNDSDADTGDSLTAVKVSDPSHGSLTLNAEGSFVYTPAVNYYGTDSFTYKAYDNKAYSNIATVTITVNAVNDAPVAVDDSYSVNEGSTLSVAARGVLSNDSDPDGNTLTAIQLSDFVMLTLNTDGSFAFTPPSAGTYTFTYKANDGTLDSNVATVTIIVNAVQPADTEAPTWPDGSTISALIITKNSVTLDWDSAADNIGIASYKIYQTGYASKTYNVSGSTLQYKVTGLRSKKTYTFGVEAYDAAGNSVYGPSVTITTP